MSVDLVQNIFKKDVKDYIQFQRFLHNRKECSRCKVQYSYREKFRENDHEKIIFTKFFSIRILNFTSRAFFSTL